MNPTLQQQYEEIKNDRAINALAKAIRQNETDFDNAKSNPYLQSHDSGTGFGAYGFQKSTWKTWAKQYAGDENLIPTPANQDMIAALAIRDSIKQYGKAADVLSSWNSGKPASQAKAGFNSKIGLAYDTPAYIQNGINNFKKYYDATPATAPQAPAQNNFGLNTAVAEAPAPKQTILQQTIDQQVPGPLPGGQYGKELKGGENFQRQALYDEGQPVSVNPAKTKPSLLGGIVRAPLQLAASGFESVRKPVQAALGLATGNEEMVSGANPYQPRKNPYLGDIYPIGYGKGIEQDKPGLGRSLRELAKTTSQGLEAAGYIGGAPATAVKAATGTLARNTLGKSLLGSLATQGAASGGSTLFGDISEKKPFIDTAIDTALSTAVGTATDAGIKGLNTGLRSLLQPKKYISDTIKNSPQYVKDVLKGSSDVSKESLPPEYVTKNFGVKPEEKQFAEKVFDAIGVKYRPKSFSGGKRLDVSDGLFKVGQDLDKTAEKTNFLTRIIPGKIDEAPVLEATEKALDGKVKRSTAFPEAWKALTDKIQAKFENARVGGTRSRRLTATDLNELIQEVGADAYSKDASGSVNAARKAVFDAFRINARDVIAQHAENSGMKDVAKAFKDSIEEYHFGKSIQSVLEDVKINPEATSQLGTHMFGLASAGVSKNPLLYVPARLGAKYLGETAAELKVNSKYFSKLIDELERRAREKGDETFIELLTKYKK